MYFVYAIQNSAGRIYIGQTENLENRLRLHNSGSVKSTRDVGPWTYLKTERFESRNEARFFEWQLKRSRGRRLIWLSK